MAGSELSAPETVRIAELMSLVEERTVRLLSEEGGLEVEPAGDGEDESGPALYELVSTIPIRGALAGSVFLSAEPPVARSMLEQMGIGKLCREEIESLLADVLTEGLNIILGNTVGAAAQIGLAIGVCPPFAIGQGAAEAQRALCRDLPFRRTLRTNAGAVSLLYVCGE